MRYVSPFAVTCLFIPGSRGPDWTWGDELEDIQYTKNFKAIREDVAENGVREPILLGDDGRLWDGHHRLLASISLGNLAIPVKFSKEG